MSVTGARPSCSPIGDACRRRPTTLKPIPGSGIDEHRGGTTHRAPPRRRVTERVGGENAPMYVPYTSGSLELTAERYERL